MKTWRNDSLTKRDREMRPVAKIVDYIWINAAQIKLIWFGDSVSGAETI